MRSVWLRLFFIILASPAFFAGAQVTISGKIRDRKKPISGVNIVLKDTYDGATSDSLGRFSFKTTEKGDFVLAATYVGYNTFEQKIKIGEEPITLDIVLKEEVTELNAVTVTAGTFEASDKKKAAAVLDPLDIVTTASANGDITGALKTLPGAQQVGESEGLFVRGGTGAETKTFIDGTLVNNFFYSSLPNIATFSRFNPFIFKGTVFSTGGYSALYGQGLSSALILESIDLPERSSANVGFSVLNLSGGYQQLAKNKKSSWGVSYAYTDLTLAFAVLKQNQDYSQVPTYHNADANFRIKTSNTGMLKYYGYLSHNQLAFTVNSIDSLGYLDKFAQKNTNYYHNLSWRESLGRRWKIYTGVSYTNNKDDIISGMQDEAKNDVILTGLEFKSFTANNKGNYFNAKLVLEKRLKGLSAIRFGSEYNYTNDKLLFTTYDNQQFPANLKENINSVFAEGDIYITRVLAAKVGGRMEHSSILDETNFAPRVSVAYKLSKTAQASLAYGVFYQDPERRYLPSPYTLDYMKATHYIAQYQKVASGQSFRAEVFYKKYENLIKTSLANGAETAINNNGFGDAKGIEFFWRDKKTVKTLDYWISYSYLDTERDYLNFPYAITPNYVAKHTGSIVVKKFVQQWKMNLNAAYNYNSGRPYYNIRLDTATSVYKFNDRGMIPDYHNVSFAINYLPFIGKKDPKAYTVWVLQVSNIFNIKQAYGYQYSYNGYRKQEIVPPSRMFVFIGCFISFGIDRSDEVMNNAF